jgi:hypothetical protein
MLKEVQEQRKEDTNTNQNEANNAKLSLCFAKRTRIENIHWIHSPERS